MTARVGLGWLILAYVAQSAIMIDTFAEDRISLLIGGTNEVVHHESRPGVPLLDQSTEQPMALDKSIVFRGREKDIENAIRPPKSNQPISIPLCSSAKTRRLKVGPASLDPESVLDVVLYPPSLAVKASQWKGASIEFRDYESYSESIRRVPAFAFIMNLGIRCVPTRALFVSEGGTQYLEFREGENAWSE